MDDANTFIGIFGLYALMAIIHMVLVVWIYRDADETYGTGCFWALCLIVVPFIALPVYLFMKLGTHRSISEDLAAYERREKQQRLGYRFSGTVMDLSKDLQDEVKHQQRREGYTLTAEELPRGFKPFSMTYGDSAERYIRSKTAEQPGRQNSGWASEGEQEGRIGEQ